MVTPSNSISDYDYYYSSSSSEEDFKASAAKSRAKMNPRDKMNRTKKTEPRGPLNNRKVTYAELMKRKAETDEMEDRQRRKDRIRRRIAAAEEKLRTRADGVPSDSDASEDEPVWVPPERKIKPDRYTREIERAIKAAEREEDEDSDSDDLDIHLDFVNGPDSNSDEDDDDEESDNSDKSDDSDESDD